MKFAAPFKSLLLLLLVATLTACGGGGGSGNDSGFNPPGVTLSSSTTNVALNTRSATTITVRMNQANGAPVANGSQISATLNNAVLGNLAALGASGNGATASGTTVGGAVTFVFQTGANAGSGSITFSGVDPITTGRTVSQTVPVTVSVGPGNDPRISCQPEKTQIPVNARGVPFFIGSPFVSEVLVNIRSATGQAINDTRDGDQAVQFSIDPVELGAVSILDDPETEDVNELTTPWGAIFAGVTAGTARAFVWSRGQAGTVNLRAAFTDPDTGQRVEAVCPFTIVSQISNLPATVTISSPQGPIYVTNSGGPTTGQLVVEVTDGSGNSVPNPIAGNTAWNNVRLELIQIDGGDARLVATNAAGTTVEGTVVNTRTFDGIANVLVRAGLRTGNYTVRAIIDRADNNVDNGLQDPVVADRGVVISDGRLFNIEITQPIENALVINPVDPDTDPGTTPPSPNGSYSLTVAIVATDRQGNPVIPGTPIRFGLIDDPQASGVGDFFIAGNDGNPQEGGLIFTAPSGQFTTAGGGAGPGDSLVIFGKDVPGNRDLESQRIVASIQSRSQLTVQRRFNLNDDTGTSVDYGPVLPYVIGRATSGNIVAEGLTDELGVARTTMTYPISRLGRRIIVWAQGEGDIVNGVPETVGDVDILAFAGVAPLEITASPSSIPANTTSNVTVCVSDALGSALQGVPIGFSFNGLSGTGSVDGIANSGTLADVTGVDGCTVASVVTAGVSSDGATLVFSAGGDTAEVEIVRGDLVLQAIPSVITTSSTLLRLRLLNGNGQPQAGYQIIGTCTGSNGTIIALSNGPGVTNAQGETTVQVTATNLDQINSAGGGECTFSTVDESAEVTVELIGQDLCDLGVSPLPEGCTPPTMFTLTLNLADGAAAPNGFAVTSSPGGLACSAPSGGTVTCSAEFEEGTVIGLATLPVASGPDVTWTGGCVPVGGTNPSDQATTTMNADVTCTATAP